MTFLAAAFFAGLATLAVPLWLHRTAQRAPADATVASLMFMREAEQPVRQRRALAHKALLALRLVLLAVLVCAFAQPMWETVGGGEEPVGAARLIVVDGSLSMRRRGVWEKALAAARRLREQGVGPVRFALATDIVTLADDLDGLKRGWMRWDLAGLPANLGALLAALPEAPSGWRAHVISDFQASAVPERFNALLGEHGFAGGVYLHPVGAEGANWSVDSVRVVGERVQAVVASFADRPRTLEVTLSPVREAAEPKNTSSATAQVTLPADARRQVEFALPAPARRPVAWRVSLADAGDALAADDARLFVQAGTQAAVVGVLGSPDGAPRRFLDAALAASATIRPVPLGADSWPPRLAAVVAVDPGELAPARQRRLQRHFDGGGGMLLISGPATLRQGALPLAGASLALSPVRSERRVLASRPGHPLAKAGWKEVTVTRSLTVATTAAETILSVVPSVATTPGNAGAEPLLVETRAGQGRMVVLLTALHRDWSDLALHPAFVTLVHDAVDYLAREKPLHATVGEPVAVGASALQLFAQSGDRVPGSRPGGRALRVEQPGLYTVRSPGGATLLAVNVDARESDPRPVSPQLLARWQAALRPPEVAPVLSGTGAETHTLPLAGALLALALLCLLAESLVANHGWPRLARLARA